MMVSGTLVGKTALVTGASRGIGREIVRSLLAAGANVVLFGRDEQGLQQAANHHRRAYLVAGDVNKAADRQRLVRAAIERFAGIDIFVPAAGVVQFAAATDLTEETLIYHLGTNFISTVLLTNLVVPHMRSGGSIVYISSSITTGGFSGLAAYSASKGALEAYMRTAAVEFAKQGIIVNAVAPGPTKTEMWSRALPLQAFEQAAAQIGPRLLTNEFNDPEDVAGVVLALIGNPIVRGHRVVADAGFSITA